MENVVNHSFESNQSSNFSKIQQFYVADIQKYNEQNSTKSDACIKIKDSGYSFNSFPLTIQKLRCLICLSNGFSPKKTANVLNISYQTLNYHLVELRYRLGFPSKKLMIAELQISDFGKSISCLTTNIQLLWKLIKEKEPHKYLKH